MSALLSVAHEPAGVVMDPVHGAITLDQHERLVLDHPLLQRLRSIRQNDVTEYVFPGATHTRFGHSLGVMHLASACFDSVVEAAMSHRGGRMLRNRDALDSALSYFRSLVRAAGLLHDVGHGPFSHAFESSRAVRSLFLSDDIFRRLWHGKDWRRYIAEPPLGFSHTMYAIRLTLEILDDTGTRQDLFATSDLPFFPDDVLCLLEGSICPPSDTFRGHAGALAVALGIPRIEPEQAASHARSLLKSILTGTVNADTLDWVLRDSYYTGSEYGVFNLAHLVSSLRLGYTLDARGKVQWVGVALAEKGLGDLEHFAFARMQLYRRVYGHKAIVGFKVLLEHAFEEVLQDPMTRRHTANALSDPKRLSTLHDYSVWTQFIEHAAEDKDSACHDLISRRKLRFLALLADPSSHLLTATVADLQARAGRERIVAEETVLRSRLTDTTAEPIRVLTEADGRLSIRDLRSDEAFNGRQYDLRTVHLYAVNAGWARAQPIETRPSRGLLICGAGLPCAGKSSVMRHLAGKLGARYFREPEEVRWPEAVMRREAMGYFTALTWFRSVRVQNLVNASECRERGEIAIVDSYYDKLIADYLGKPAVQWLLPTSDPYYPAFAAVARLDYERLPNADVLVVFKVTEDDWHRFLRTRGRLLDTDSAFLRSYDSQQYFIDAAQRLEAEQGVKCHIFERRFLESATPTEDAAEELTAQLSPYLDDAAAAFTRQ